MGPRRGGCLGELLGEDGDNWLRGSYNNGRGNFCLVEGLRHIRKTTGEGGHASAYLGRAVKRRTGVHYTDIVIVLSIAREMALNDACGVPR